MIPFRRREMLGQVDATTPVDTEECVMRTTTGRRYHEKRTTGERGIDRGVDNRNCCSRRKQLARGRQDAPCSRFPCTLDYLSFCTACLMVDNFVPDAVAPSGYCFYFSFFVVRTARRSSVVYDIWLHVPCSICKDYHVHVLVLTLSLASSENHFALCFGLISHVACTSGVASCVE